MHKVLLLIVALLLTFGMPSAQDTFEVEGQGVGANQNEALTAAKRDAIEKGIGMILLSQTEIENFQVKRDLVLTKTIGAVKSYQILSQLTDADGLLNIKIKATVSKSAMRDDLAAFQILIESMDKPKVMIVINESNIDNDDPGNASAENAITSVLKDPYEFEIVDQKIVSTIKSNKQRMASLAGNDVEAAALGTQFGAEVLITGTAISRRAEALSKDLGGMISVQADVTIKAISCATGRVIAAASEHAAKVHVSPQTAGTQAIAAAADKCTKKMLDALIKDWQNQANNGMPLNITVNNVPTFRVKNNVIQTLKGISGISGVYERSWNAQSGLLTVDIQYKGNPNGLATKVDGYKLTSGGGSLAVTGINGQEVTLSVQAL
jgi:hypothetical protein